MSQQYWNSFSDEVKQIYSLETYQEHAEPFIFTTMDNYISTIFNCGPKPHELMHYRWRIKKANEAKDLEPYGWNYVRDRVDDYLCGFLPPNTNLSTFPGMHLLTNLTDLI